MKIVAVEIKRSYKTTDHFECSVSLQSDYGAMNLRIPEDRVQQLVDVVSDLIIEAGKDVAQNLTRQAMARAAIEHQS